jgi:hypothetical protein
MRAKFSWLSFFMALGALPAAAATPATPSPCAAVEHHQFDFWVGKWDVYPAAQPDKLVAHSLIESLYGGCVVRENWMPLNGNRGGSINAYDGSTKRWRQFWADGQAGSALFTGGLEGKAMVLTGHWPQPDHPRQMTRMTYTRHDNGSVQQTGVTSDDDGKTWQPSFDFLYRPAHP